MDNVPVFLKIDEFRKLKTHIEEIKGKVELSEKLIGELKKANAEEQKRIESFEEQLNKVKNIIHTINSKIESANEE